MENHLETKFNISSNSMRSESEQILVFQSVLYENVQQYYNNTLAVK